jgi:hypothetical protein
MKILLVAYLISLYEYLSRLVQEVLAINVYNRLHNFAIIPKAKQNLAGTNQGEVLYLHNSKFDFYVNACS